MKKILLLIVALIYNNVYVAATESVDTVRSRSETFRPKNLILPVSLISAGATGLWIGAVKDLNRSVNDGFKDLRGDHRVFSADNYLQFLPFVAYEGLGLIGVPSRHAFRDRLMAGLTAELALEVLTRGWKAAVDETRPDGSRHSFPSGHAARAFAGAELIRLDYGIAPAVTAYAFATGIALMRLYNNRHWLTDVVAGAGIGILSARIGHWMLPVYRRWFGWTGPGAFVALPLYDPELQAPGIALALRF